MKHKLLVTALLALPFAAAAADTPKGNAFPQRPVRMIVPYAPGGATDIIARQLAAKLNDVWGVGVVVDNRSGASGNIALETAAKAAPDGYTLLVGNVSTNAINETTFAKMKAQGLDPSAYLADNDATTFFAATGDLLLTGPTLTNVNDVRVILVD